VAASRATARVSPWALIALGVLLAATAFAYLHDGHYRERRLQLLEHKVEGIENVLTGKHGRTT
jgi:hypothetical protein